MGRLDLKRIGFFSALVYAANAFHYGWSPTTRGAIDDLLAWIALLVILGLYWTGYKCLAAGRIHSFKDVLVPAIPLIALSFATIPYDSTDVFLYMDAGWEQAHYGLNPYSHVLRDIPDVAQDPIVRTDWMQPSKNPWLDLPFVYGFLFALVTEAIAWIGHGHWWITLALFKFLCVAAYLGCARIVWVMKKAVGDLRPDIPLYVFSWSPLILQHHIGNAHNDLLVAYLVVLAAYLMTNRRYILAAPAALAASAMIKYVTLPLLPLSLWFIGRRNGWIRATAAGLVATLLTALVSLPYLGEISRFRFDLIVAQLSKVTAGSLYSFFFYIYRFVERFRAPSGSTETFGLSLKILLWSIGAFWVLAETLRFCRKRQPSIDDWIEASSGILVAVLFIASSQFYSWYIGMLFPLVLLLQSDHWLRSFLILTSGAHVFSLTSLSRKGIGYFLLTLIPAVAIGKTAIKDRRHRGSPN